MSKNPVLYKALVVGVIILFIGLGVQPAFASVNPVIMSESKPDLILYDILTDENPWGFPYFKIKIKNDGNESIPKGTEIKTWLILKRLVIPKEECFDEVEITLKKALNPGGKISFNIGSKCILRIPSIFIGRIIIDIDPNNYVKESNEENNNIWGYILGTGFADPDAPPCIFCNYIIGRLRQQKSSTKGEMEDIYNPLKDCPCLQE